MAEKPYMEVTFRQRAVSFMERSERGIAALIIRDDTDATVYKEYRNNTEALADKAKYTEANLRAIKDVFISAPYKLAVVRILDGKGIEDALKAIADNLDTCRIGVADGTAEDTATVASWIKSMEKEGRTYKALLYNASAPDSMHIENFTTATVTYADDRGQKAGSAYIPSLLGMLAAANVSRSVTYMACTDLVDCAKSVDAAADVKDGKLILERSGNTVRIASGCNSQTTTDGETKTEDMQYIETVEAMDMIADDIRAEFRDNYLGNYRNTYDNQMLFIGAVNGYLRDLEQENILDREYENTAYIDVNAQRAAWIASGKIDAAEWTDAQVRKTPFKRTVYLVLDIKINGSMEKLYVAVQMY